MYLLPDDSPEYAGVGRCSCIKWLIVDDPIVSVVPEGTICRCRTVIAEQTVSERVCKVQVSRRALVSHDAS